MSECLVLVHLAPNALLNHIEWTISGACGAPSHLNWIPNESPIASSRAALAIKCSHESAAILASAFMNLKQISFEIVHQSNHVGTRWSYTPNLGMFSCSTDAVGNLVVNENQLRSALERAGSNALKIQAEIRRLLGQAWDDELESSRELVCGAEGNYCVVPTESERITYSQNVRPI